MSDLDHSHSPLPDLEDPSVTRLMVRRHDDRAAGLLAHSGPVVTSISMVVPAGGSAGERHVEGLEAWNPDRIRVEVLVMESPEDPARSTLRDRLARSGRSWRVLPRPQGGRVAALSMSAQDAEHEFVLIGSGGPSPYALIGPALSHMWAEGGDAALLDIGHEGDLDVPTVCDTSMELAVWLGLSGVPVPGRLVLLRRWVARWLFNELTRAISPADEVADRARLLGIGVVRMSLDAGPHDTVQLR